MTFTNGIKSPINGPESYVAASYATAPQPPAPIRTHSNSHFGVPPAQTVSSPLNQSSVSPSAADRGGVPRRFTTNALPTLNTLASASMVTPLSPIGQQRRQAAEQQSMVPEFGSVVSYIFISCTESLNNSWVKPCQMHQISSLSGCSDADDAWPKGCCLFASWQPISFFV
jgi:hypothetical protein